MGIFFSIASWMSNMFDMFKFNSKPYWDRLRGWREMPRRVYRWCPCRCHLHYWSWMMGCQKTATPLFDPQNTVPSAPFVRHLCAICAPFVSSRVITWRSSPPFRGDGMLVTSWDQSNSTWRYLELETPESPMNHHNLENLRTCPV